MKKQMREKKSNIQRMAILNNLHLSIPDNVQKQIQEFCYSNRQDLIGFADYIIRTYGALGYQNSLFDMISDTRKESIMQKITNDLRGLRFTHSGVSASSSIQR